MGNDGALTMPSILNSVRSLKRYLLVPLYSLLGSRTTISVTGETTTVVLWLYLNGKCPPACQTTEDPLLFFSPSLVFLSTVACSCFHMASCSSRHWQVLPDCEQ